MQGCSTRAKFTALVGLGLTALGSPSQGQARTAIVVAPILTTDQVSFYYARQQALFERAGLDITVSPATSGSAAIVAVVGGAAQIGYSNTFSLAVARSHGIPIQMISPGGLYESASPIAKLIVAADAPFRTAKDLEGHVVASTGLHDLLSVSIRSWLDAGGADISNVKFVEMPPGAMLAALQAKRVDAAAMYEPFLVAAEASGARVIGKPYDAIAPEFEAGSWFTLSSWANGHRDAVLRFSEALHQAGRYVNDHFDDVIPLIVGYAKSDPEMLRKSGKVVYPASFTPAILQPVLNAAVHYQEISGPLRAQDLIFPGVP